MRRSRSAIPWLPRGGSVLATARGGPAPSLRVLVLVVLAVGAGAPARAAETWVDASATGQGDGTRNHPFKRLGEALRSGAGALHLHLHLAAGLYAGPFELPSGTVIDGPKEAVLHAEGPAVVETQGSVALEGVSVQGGAEGISSRGATTLRGVHFSGQHKAAVVARGGRLSLDGVELEASMSEVLGVALEGDATAELRRVRWSGPFATALEARFDPPRSGGSTSIVLEHGAIEGAVRGIRAVGAGRVVLREITIEHGRAEGVLIARCSGELDGVTVKDHEYGLVFTDGADVVGRRVTADGAYRAGIAVTFARALLTGLQVRRSGEFGGVQVVGGSVWLERFRVEAGTGYGFVSKLGHVVLHDGAILDTRDPDGATGDGVQLRGGEAQVVSVYVGHSANDGLLAAEGTHATLIDVTLADSGTAGVVVETEAELGGVGVAVEKSGGPGLLVMTHGAAALDDWAFRGLDEPALSPECTAGAQIRLHRVTPADAEGPPAPCVQRGPALKPALWTLDEWRSYPIRSSR